MDGTEQQKQNGSPGNGATPPEIKQQAQPPKPTSTEIEDQGDGPVLHIPRSAMKAEKAKAAERGAKNERKALEEKAKAAGYESLDAMFAAQSGTKPKHGGQPMAENNKNKNSNQQAAPANGTNGSPAQPQNNGQQRDRNKEKYEKQLEEQRQRTERLKQRAQEETRRRRDAERQLAATKAESHLRLVASRQGITDVDYAIFHLKQDQRGKSVDELSKFDEAAYFTDLKEKYPMLTQEVKVAANTALPPTDAQPTPMKPSAAPGKKAENDKPVDTRSMTSEQFAEYRRKEYGLTS